MAKKNEITVRILPQDISSSLRLWRKFSGLKQSELEQRAGLAHNAVSRIETGEVSPKLETIESLARAMDISFEELQFRLPPATFKKDGDDCVAGLDARLKTFPPETRNRLADLFHSMLDLLEKD